MGLVSQFRSFLSTAAVRAEATGVGLSPLDALDDRYFSHLGYRTQSGTYVSPGSAQRLAAVWACVRVCAETVGSLPVGIYRWRKDGGKERFDDHPLAPVLHKPNLRQSSFDFWQMVQGHIELRGNSYVEIVNGSEMTGRFRAIDQLIPLHPDRVTVYLLSNGRLRYEVRSYYGSAATRSIPQEYMLHFRSRSEDGIMGVSAITAMAEVIGKGLAQQQHASRSFSNQAIPGLVLESTIKMDDDRRQKMVESISEGFSGPNAFKVFATPLGTTVKALGLSNRDSQLVEALNATRTDIAGGYRVPPHKIGDLSRGTFSNIEQQNIEFATDCIRPRVVAIEARVDCDLIDPINQGIGLEPGEAFLVLNMDALYRGDLKSRYEAYMQALPWMRRNEIRTAEGFNPDPNPACNELLVPVNMETVSQAQRRSDANLAAAQGNDTSDDKKEDTDEEQNYQQSGGGAENTDVDERDANAKSGHRKTAAMRARALATAAAERIVRREVKVLRKAAGQLDRAVFERDVTDLYSSLTPMIMENLRVGRTAAAHYAGQHRSSIFAANGDLPLAIDQIETQGVAMLEYLALGGRGEREAKLEAVSQI